MPTTTRLAVIAALACVAVSVLGKPFDSMVQNHVKLRGLLIYEVWQDSGLRFCNAYGMQVLEEVSYAQNIDA